MGVHKAIGAELAEEGIFRTVPQRPGISPPPYSPGWAPKRVLRRAPMPASERPVCLTAGKLPAPPGICQGPCSAG